jgi:hypothetical protein
MLPELIKDHYQLNSGQIQQLAGGDINEVFRIQYNDTPKVIKVNQKTTYPGMFEAEAKGLDLLRSAHSFKIPDVFATFELNDWQILELEFLQTGRERDNFPEIFAEQLVKLHQTTTTHFGLNHDNYIGSLRQSNRQHDSWTEFFISERLIPQTKLAVDNGLIEAAERRLIETFGKYVDEIWPKEQPALLHGDLWSGNYMLSETGEPVLIDPSVYYGHREIDLGMMALFGGFNSNIISHYNALYPLEKGWQERTPYNQIYPLLVHLNLFGRTYWRQIKSILQEFS